MNTIDFLSFIFRTLSIFLYSYLGTAYILNRLNIKHWFGSIIFAYLFSIFDAAIELLRFYTPYRSILIVDLILMLSLYYIFRRHESKSNQRVLFAIFSTYLIIEIYVMSLGEFSLLYLINKFGFIHFRHYIYVLLMYIVFVVFFSILLKTLMNKLDTQYNKLPTANFIMATILNIIFLYRYLTHYLDISYLLIFHGLVFLVIQLIIGYFFFRYVSKRIERNYQVKLKAQYLEQMVKYNKELEANQSKLRKFKHDYKSMLMSANKMIQENEIEELKSYLSSLQNYSKRELHSSIQHYADIKHIQNIPIKSFLLEKFYYLNREDINFQFECPYIIKDFQIDDFDLIRLLGILIDNAHEAVSELSKGQITLLFIRLEDTIDIYIENSLSQEIPKEQITQEGYTTKEGHDGLGLPSALDICNTYDTLSLDFEIKEDIFSAIIRIQLTSEE